MTEGLLISKSLCPPSETIDRLAEALIERGMKVFSRIDFPADAAEACLCLETTILLVFGNPKVGTALLQQNQQSGIDLPLKGIQLGRRASCEYAGRSRRSTRCASYPQLSLPLNADNAVLSNAFLLR